MMITKHKWIRYDRLVWITMSRHLLWKFCAVAFLCLLCSDWAGVAHAARCTLPGLEKCDCTLTTVTCINKHFNTTKGLGYLPEKYPRVKSVIFRGNRIGELKVNMLVRNCNTNRKLLSLTYLDLSNNHISLIHGKTFHCTPILDTLILDNNKWLLGHHVRVFSNLEKLKKLSMINTFAAHNNSKRHITHLRWVFNQSKLNELEELHLERNQIYYFKNSTFCELPALKKLYLSNNNILNPDIDYKCMRKQNFELHLDNNAFMTLSRSFMSNIDLMHVPGYSVMLNISNNPFKCNCELKEFHAWLNKTIVHIDKKDKLTCAQPDNLRGRTILSLKPSDLQCKTPVPMDEHLEASYIVIGLILGTVGVLSLVVLYLNREGIKERVRDICEPLQLTHSNLAQGHFGYASVQNPDV